MLVVDNEAFDIDMIYVNVEKGSYDAFMFYKMQSIYQPMQDLTVLWCRWGRPGETGNHQQTPYSDRDEQLKNLQKYLNQKH